MIIKNPDGTTVDCSKPVDDCSTPCPDTEGMEFPCPDDGGFYVYIIDDNPEREKK